jgi:hypothetical protein
MVAGETIYFGNSILKKIESPEIAELRRLWPSLCQFSHATIYSYQVETEFKVVKQEILGNLAMLIMLLGRNFHLINRHFITPSMKRCNKRYCKNGDYTKSRDAAKEAVKTASQYISKEGESIIREYSSSWKIK